jgi:hypothetical protein
LLIEKQIFFATHGKNLNVNIFDMSNYTPDTFKDSIPQETYALYDAYLDHLKTGKDSSASREEKRWQRIPKASLPFRLSSV